MTANPLQSPLAMHQSPRCTARSKRTGKLCRSPAVKGWSVCRMHGARGGAPKGERNGAYRHGGYTQDAIQSAQLLKAFLKAVTPMVD